MKKKVEQTYMPKNDWPDGPWKNEPDRVSWVDERTGYHCLAKRNGSGFWCGYVSVEKDHPLYETRYQDNDYEIVNTFNVHGGITYTDHCDDDVEFGICHLTKSDDKAWWFGFDCGHASDLKPITPMNKEILFARAIDCLIEGYDDNPVYRDISYVTSEVESLAKQLKDSEYTNDQE